MGRFVALERNQIYEILVPFPPTPPNTSFTFSAASQGRWQARSQGFCRSLDQGEGDQMEFTH